MRSRQTTFTRSARTAARFILDDDTAAFPTETVYGLGANVYSEQALKKIFSAKGRPADNPLIVHVSSIGQIALLTPNIPASAQTIIDHFFPGPITVIVPKRPEISPLVSAGLDTIGIRMPRHETAQRFLRACGVPVAAPSANLSGTPSPTSWQSVRDDLDGRIGCILKGTKTQVGLESTVVDCTGRRPVVLRSGAVTLEALRAVLPSTTLYKKKKSPGDAVKSPGMKYRHYSPKARVIVVSPIRIPAPEPLSAYIGLHTPVHEAKFSLVRLCADIDEYARVVFSFFRQCDKKHVRTIYCEEVTHEGIGRAVMDRIRRAAHH
jgi:L-threonylcarbamoyladenylate synthase